ncbi:hypothetical protein Tco_0241148 [Tanacetum coccineum]
MERMEFKDVIDPALGSILVNDSPTAEFKFPKGLSKEPLIVLFIILVMESLHLSFNNIINADLFKGIRFDDSLTLSHLFYADDAVFIGKWDRANILTIVPNIIGCSTFSTPFSYLGVKVGMSPSRRKAWDEIIGSVSSLSPWNCILKELNSLSAKGINLLALLKKKVGNGANTLFWEDCWINDVPLSRSFPRLYALELKKETPGGVEEEQLHNLVELVVTISLSPSMIDAWLLVKSSGEFLFHIG